MPSFDLVIADEAHRCAGPVSPDFATILDAEVIKARRRLFMTATPRYFTCRVVREAKEAEFEVASMDNEELGRNVGLPLRVPPHAASGRLDNVASWCGRQAVPAPALRVSEAQVPAGTLTGRRFVTADRLQPLECSSAFQRQPRTNTFHHPEKLLYNEDEGDDAA